MFLAWRDLRFARGRFALIGAVVALITLLVGFLAGLTGGLASQNVSGILGLPGDRLVLEQPSNGPSSFSESAIEPGVAETWQGAAGVEAAVPVGITQGRVVGGGTPVAVALFGLPPASGGTSPVAGLAPSSDHQVGLSAGAADQLGASTGDRVTIGEAEFTIATVGADVWYSHTPVVVMSPTAWASTDRGLGGTGEATVIAVSGDPDWDAVAKSTHTTATTRIGSLTSLDTFTSEVGSLGLMIVMLFGVSALVVGAFFTVWTMQRAGDLAVLKALGASTGSLIRDALGQALVVLTIGIGIGILAVAGFGTVAGSALPFLLSPLTTLAPAAALAVLGLAGAAVALRTITRAEPLTALGSSR